MRPGAARGTGESGRGARASSFHVPRRPGAGPLWPGVLLRRGVGSGWDSLAWRNEGFTGAAAAAAIQALHLHSGGNNFSRRFGALESDVQLLGQHRVLPSSREQWYMDVDIAPLTLKKIEWLVRAFTI